jgi:hypothetical protein
LIVVIVVVVVVAEVEVFNVGSLSDLLLNNLIFADTRPIAGEEGDDILYFLQYHWKSLLVLYKKKKKKEKRRNM